MGGVETVGAGAGAAGGGGGCSGSAAPPQAKIANERHIIAVSKLKVLIRTIYCRFIAASCSKGTHSERGDTTIAAKIDEFVR